MTLKYKVECEDEKEKNETGMFIGDFFFDVWPLSYLHATRRLDTMLITDSIKPSQDFPIL